ncbi:MAG: histidinol-phosphatase [Myxococcota bacterium]
MEPLPWMVSLHGGHSGQFCDHAEGRLEEVLEAAVAAGFRVFGISEHAPRLGAQFLYDKEVELGWDVAHLEALFDAYAQVSATLVESFADRLTVLRGFEAEVVPTDRFAEVMLGYRERYGFEFMIGSVHHLDDTSIDGPMHLFEEVVERRGGLEAVAVAYYEAVIGMVEALKPEVVGHLDLIRKNGWRLGPVDTPPIRIAAEGALEVIRDQGCVLDLNTAGYRKGLETPYPAPWIVERALDMGIGFCFGDDSHGPDQVGAGMEESRRYLLKHGVTHIRAPSRQGKDLVWDDVSLEV